MRAYSPPAPLALRSLSPVSKIGSKRSGRPRLRNRDRGRNENKAVLYCCGKTFIKKPRKATSSKEVWAVLFWKKSSQKKNVKDYAQMLVDDHSKDLKDVVDLMNQKGMPQPKDLPE